MKAATLRVKWAGIVILKTSRRCRKVCINHKGTQCHNQRNFITHHNNVRSFIILNTQSDVRDYMFIMKRAINFKATDYHVHRILTSSGEIFFPSAEAVTKVTHVVETDFFSWAKSNNWNVPLTRITADDCSAHFYF